MVMDTYRKFTTATPFVAGTEKTIIFRKFIFFKWIVIKSHIYGEKRFRLKSFLFRPMFATLKEENSVLQRLIVFVGENVSIRSK